MLGSGIPDKGKVLTQLSAFWFERMGDLVPHHVMITLDVDDFPASPRPPCRDAARADRCSCRRTQPLPIECVARGYLSGSGWKEYQQTGSVCGVTLPAGLRESDRLPKPIFTPATKAETGHDINISEEEAGADRRRAADRRAEGAHARDLPRGCAHAESKGIIIADTKFEFGLVGDGNPRRTESCLIDEVLTPDSSRFWPRIGIRAGHGQPSFDKQFVRDYLEEIRWNKQPPVPSLPDDVVRRTREKHVEAFRLLSGRELAVAAVRDQLEKLVQEMLDKGVQYDDARREFEKMFITRALQRSKGNRRRCRRPARPPPQHRRAEDDGASDQTPNTGGQPRP